MTDPDKLIGDLRKVKEVSDTSLEAKSRISNFEGKREDVLGWYFSQDPLQEVGALRAIESTRDGNIHLAGLEVKNYLEQSWAYLNGAGILLANVFIPDVIEIKNGNQRKAKIAELLSANIGNNIYLDFNSAMLLIGGLANFAALESSTKTLTLSQLEDMLIASEMINAASATLYPMADEASDNNLKKTAFTYRRIGHHVERTILDQTLYRDTEDKEKQLLGLYTMGSFYSKLFSIMPNSTPEVRTRSENLWNQALLEYIGYFEKIFISNGLLKNGVDEERRGKLHELIWNLDALMYLKLHKVEGLYVFPSYSSQDKPEVGYPAANRGFDFFITDDKLRVKYVQLKSRPNPKINKEYHPLVTELREKNFEDINKGGRLFLKLKTYREFIESGRDPKFTEKVSYYLLPTVKEAFKDFDTSAQKPLEAVGKIYGDRASDTVTLNRQQRRQLARREKKKRN